MDRKCSTLHAFHFPRRLYINPVNLFELVELVSFTNKIHHSAMRGSVFLTADILSESDTGSNKLQLRGLKYLLVFSININTCLRRAVIYFPKQVKRFLQIVSEIIQNKKMYI